MFMRHYRCIHSLLVFHSMMMDRSMIMLGSRKVYEFLRWTILIFCMFGLLTEWFILQRWRCWQQQCAGNWLLGLQIPRLVLELPFFTSQLPISAMKIGRKTFHQFVMRMTNQMQHGKIHNIHLDLIEAHFVVYNSILSLNTRCHTQYESLIFVYFLTWFFTHKLNKFYSDFIHLLL